MTVVVAAITAIGGTTIGSLILSTVARLALSFALSKLLAPDAPEQPRDPGLRIKTTMPGGVNPFSFIAGEYATGGVWVCPPYTHTKAGSGRPNAYLTYVIELGDIQGASLTGLILDGQYVTISGTTHPDFGNKIMGKFENYAWIKFYDGTQTTTDSMMLAKYGTYPRRPWQSDMIGRGVPHAILTFRLNRKLFPDYPKARFVLDNKWYDLRKDTTAGGSGGHRWHDRSTWQSSVNNAVIIYNIARRVRFMDGSDWGGGYTADELPFDNWTAAMNKCDEPVAKAGGGTEPRYRCGRELFTSDEPSAAVEELLQGCDGRVADVGGILKIRVGGVALPVYWMTDKDIIITRGQTYDPYPVVEDTFNAVHATYPNPANLWEDTEAPPRLEATYEVLDGNERRAIKVAFPSTPHKRQVQRLQKAKLRRGRKFRTASIVMPPDAAILEPLDAISWTSARNQWTTKTFEVEQVADEPMMMLQGLNLREANPADYDWAPADELSDDDAPDGEETLSNSAVQSVVVTPSTLTDGSAVDRRPSLTLTWATADLDDVAGIEYELRRDGTATVIGRGVVTDVAAGAWMITDGILPDTAYELRTRMVIPGMDNDWSAWADVTSGNVLFVEVDLDDGAVTTPKLALYAASRLLFAFDASTTASVASSGQYMFVDNINDVLDYSAEKLCIFTANIFWSPPSALTQERVTITITHNYDPGSGPTFSARDIVQNVFSPAGSTFNIREQVAIAVLLPASVSADEVTVAATFTSGLPGGTVAEVRQSRLLMMNVKR